MSQSDLYASGSTAASSSPQTYVAPAHQVYHPTPTSPSHQLYTNVLNAPTALSYPTSGWHNGSGAEYGLYQNAAAAYYQPEYIPLEIGYATHPLEPVDVSKSLESQQPQQSAMEHNSVITLECASSTLKSAAHHHNEIKLESLEQSVASVTVPVASAVATGVPTSVVQTADTWTPLTPPQSTLQ